MAGYSVVSAQLARIEAVLREHDKWQSVAPQSSALLSDQPFCVDTLQPYEWLQWVLIPRMRALIAGGLPLPLNCVVTPYYEMALPAECSARTAILPLLREFDALFAG